MYYKCVSGKQQECKFLLCKNIWGRRHTEKPCKVRLRGNHRKCGGKRASVIFWWNRGFFLILSCSYAILSKFVIRVLREGLPTCTRKHQFLCCVVKLCDQNLERKACLPICTGKHQLGHEKAAKQPKRASVLRSECVMLADLDIRSCIPPSRREFIS